MMEKEEAKCVFAFLCAASLLVQLRKMFLHLFVFYFAAGSVFLCVIAELIT